MRYEAAKRGRILAIGITIAWTFLGSLDIVHAEEPASAPLHTRIDQHLAKSTLGWSAPLASDAEFLRRVTLDLTGTIPTPEQVRAFLADPAGDKRARVVDQLLASPEFNRYMAISFDILLMERRPDKHVKSPEWQQYLYDSFAQNKPLNVLARELLEADGRDPKNRAPAKFLLDREAEPNLLARDVGRVFFGVDVQCAQCHDHPLIADYSQRDYYGLYAFFSRSYLFADKKQKISYLAEKVEGEVQFKSVFTEEEGSAFPLAPGGMPLKDPDLPLTDLYEIPPAKDQAGVPKYSRREQLLRATDGSNPYFNRNWANRLWAHMMGRGLVEPVDLYHSDNPPTDPALLNLLGDELAACDFDVRWFLRQLALSEAYQRSFQVPATASLAADQQQAFSSELDRRLEQLEAERKEVGSKLVDAADVFAERDAELRESLAPHAKANKAAADALGKLTAAQQALEAARAAHRPKGEELATLSAAAQATQAAAQKLPDEKAVVDAAKLFETRTAKLKTEVDKLAAAVQKAEAAVAPLQAAFDKANQELEPLATAKTQKQEAALAAQNTVTQLQNQHEDLLLRINALKQQRDGLGQLVQLATIDQGLAATEQQLVELQRERDAIQQTIAKTQTAATDPATQPPATDKAADDQTADDQTADQAEAQTAAPASDVQADAEAKLAELQTTLGQLETRESELVTTRDTQRQERDELWQNVAKLGTHRFGIAGLKPLTPEQLAWSMMQATGFTDRQRVAIAAAYEKELAEASKKADAAEGAPSDAERAAEIEKRLHEKLAGSLAAFARVFGAAAGQPQNEFFATVDQALFLSNGGTLQSWLAPGGGNLADRLLKLEQPAEVAEELYVSALSRPPSAAEVQQVTQYLNEHQEDRPAAVQEMIWGLLTSAEFRFNH